MEPSAEAVRLSSNVMVYAAAGSFRLRRTLLWDIPVSAQSLPRRGRVDVTRQTMAGAIYAGLSVAQTGETTTASARQDSLLAYIHSLAMMYHTTRVTPLMLRRAAERLMAAGHHRGAERCLQVIREEQGHDGLALRDVRAFGLHAEQFMDRFHPKGARALAASYQRICDSAEPIAVFGHVYVLERLALFSTADTIAAVERLIPAGIKATRCLRVHSSVGADRRHVHESCAFIASLDPADRAAIARAAFETSRVVHTEEDDYPGDDAMRVALRELGAGPRLTDAWPTA